jgi:hypothetical protein
LSLKIHLDDDGKIIQSRVWVDGEKQFWTPKPDYIKTVNLTVGQHHIVVIAEDDQGLQTRIDRYVYVQPTKDLSE